MKDIQQFNFKGNQFRGLTDNQGTRGSSVRMHATSSTSTQIISVTRSMKTKSQTSVIRRFGISPDEHPLSSANPACTSSL